MMILMKHNQEATLTVFGGKGVVQLVQTNLFKLTFRWEEFAVGSHPCFKFFFLLSGFSTLSPVKNTKTFKTFWKPQVCQSAET